MDADVPGLTEASTAGDTELLLAIHANANAAVSLGDEEEPPEQDEDEEDRSYARAVRIIETECVDAQRTQPGLSVEQWLRISGLEPSELNKLNVIHITGSKGKGSTAACTSAILQYANPSARIGCFTSPSLVSLRERYLINGESASEQAFAETFWKIWARIASSDRPDGRKLSIPGWWTMLCLCCFHYFLDSNVRLKAQVDCLILEVGVGGLTDATNIVPFPIVTAITRLSLEHTDILGNTLREIAFQKGGIAKANAPLLTVAQTLLAEETLQRQALSRRASSFSVVSSNPALKDRPLGLTGDREVCIINASLAVAICNTFLASYRCPRAFLPYVEKVEAEYFSAISQHDQGAKLDALLTVSRSTVDRNMLALLVSSIFGLFFFSLDLPSLAVDLSGISLSASISLGSHHASTAIGSKGLVAAATLILVNLAVTYIRHPLRRAARQPSAIFLTDVQPSGIVAPPYLPEAYQKGLETARIPGRCQSITSLEGHINWMLDGAHTVESLRLSADWYLQAQAGARRRRVLIFALTKGRSAAKLLPPIFEGAHCKLPFDLVIFSTTAYTPKDLLSIHETHDVAGPEDMKNVWRDLEAGKRLASARIEACTTIEESIACVDALKQASGPISALVCGSLHLVGGVMAVCDLEVDYRCRQADLD